ncbi:hypothetical protein MLD38_014819 [Melastoma candidum]|uniref:Uncharacterized protein n=1 Tax=Melastoma candidum TaxID=119954 RepID=A0ACB9RH40_9MYRT|nr:hypothetical protein MLD38_014819 [Melastoma candidum]
MAVLRRSATSFRRQGSSGLVWDDRLLAGVLYQIKPGEDAMDGTRLGQSGRSRLTGMIDGSGSFDAMVEPVYQTKTGKALRKPRTVDVLNVTGCGFWGVFRKPRAASVKRTGDKRSRMPSYSSVQVEFL